MAIDRHQSVNILSNAFKLNTMFIKKYKNSQSILTIQIQFILKRCLMLGTQNYPPQCNVCAVKFALHKNVPIYIYNVLSCHELYSIV